MTTTRNQDAVTIPMELAGLILRQGGAMTTNQLLELRDIVNAARTQPAPTVPAEVDRKIHKILNRYITHLHDVDDATDAVMNALSQTGGNNDAAD